MFRLNFFWRSFVWLRVSVRGVCFLYLVGRWDCGHFFCEPKAGMSTDFLVFKEASEEIKKTAERGQNELDRCLERVKSDMMYRTELLRRLQAIKEKINHILTSEPMKLKCKRVPKLSLAEKTRYLSCTFSTAAAAAADTGTGAASAAATSDPMAMQTDESRAMSHASSSAPTCQAYPYAKKMRRLLSNRDVRHAREIGIVHSLHLNEQNQGIPSSALSASASASAPVSLCDTETREEREEREEGYELIKGQHATRLFVALRKEILSKSQRITSMINQTHTAMEKLRKVEEDIQKAKKKHSVDEAHTRFLMESIPFIHTHSRIHELFDVDFAQLSAEVQDVTSEEFQTRLTEIRQIRDNRLVTLDIKFIYTFQPHRLNPEEKTLYDANRVEMLDPKRIDTDINSLVCVGDLFCPKCRVGSLHGADTVGILFRCSECEYVENRALSDDMRNVDYADLNIERNKQKTTGYQKIHHFYDRLKNLFGLQTHPIPEELRVMLDNYIESQETNPNNPTEYRDKVDNHVMRSILMELQNANKNKKISDKYKCSTSFAMQLNPKWRPPVLTERQVAQITEMFRIVENAFLDTISQFPYQRKNMFSFSLVFRSICQWLGYDPSFAKMVNTLACRQLDLKQEAGWKLVARRMNLPYQPNVGNQLDVVAPLYDTQEMVTEEEAGEYESQEV